MMNKIIDRQQVSYTARKSSATSAQNTAAAGISRQPDAAGGTKPTTLINVQGVRYSVSDNGRKLKRLPQAPTVPTTPAGSGATVPTPAGSTAGLATNAVLLTQFFLTQFVKQKSTPHALGRTFFVLSTNLFLLASDP